MSTSIENHMRAQSLFYNVFKNNISVLSQGVMFTDIIIQDGNIDQTVQFHEILHHFKL